MKNSPILTLSLMLAGGATVGMLAAPTTAVAGKFSKVNANTMKANGVRYWRKNAPEAELGSVGRKMSPAIGGNSFQHKEDAPNGIYKVKTDSPITITSQQASSWGVDGGVSNVQGGVTSTSGYSGSITVYKMRIDLGDDPGDLRYETNRNIDHLRALDDQGKAGRMISTVWIAVAGEEGQAGCYSGDLSVSNGVWTVNTTASGCSSSTWTIPPGSIFAYGMVKVTKWNNQELTEKPTCPSGYTRYDTRSSPAHPMDRCEKITYKHVSVKCKLGTLDKPANWYVAARSGRDTCKSRKGKPDKDVKCSKSGYSYVAQSGKDTCRKPQSSYTEPKCPKGYTYDKNSTANGGVDQCHLRGIADLDVDSNAGF